MRRSNTWSPDSHPQRRPRPDVTGVPRESAVLLELRSWTGTVAFKLWRLLHHVALLAGEAPRRPNSQPPAVSQSKSTRIEIQNKEIRKDQGLLSWARPSVDVSPSSPGSRSGLHGSFFSCWLDPLRSPLDGWRAAALAPRAHRWFLMMRRDDKYSESVAM
uniref:Uncharacterized protein n=1 Tax=Heliothis virescens TaxID=7102 RepID=A0A2A4J8K5_HELVI